MGRAAALEGPYGRAVLRGEGGSRGETESDRRRRGGGIDGLAVGGNRVRSREQRNARDLQGRRQRRGRAEVQHLLRQGHGDADDGDCHRRHLQSGDHGAGRHLHPPGRPLQRPLGHVRLVGRPRGQLGLRERPPRQAQGHGRRERGDAGDDRQLARAARSRSASGARAPPCRARSSASPSTARP